MACFSPISAYSSKAVNPETGKRPLVFDVRKSFDGLLLRLPCGVCVGCQQSRARSWAIRCMHERRMSSESAFVTITYDDAHLPLGSSLRKSDVQLFMKRLRKARPTGVRYFLAGEYGDTTLRPHYHILLFNASFPDRRFYKRSPSGFDLYTSEELRRLWPLGNNYLGEVTAGSAAYVARYCLKKAFGAVVSDGREPEFRLMSRRPGIGALWFDRYSSEAYAHDSAVLDAHVVSLPRYYDDRFKLIDSDRLDELKRDRRRAAEDRWLDNTPERLRVREEFEQRKALRFARDL